MGLKPATDPDDLVQLVTQVTRAQREWLEAERRRCDDRSISSVIRRAIRDLMEEDEEIRERLS